VIAPALLGLALAAAVPQELPRFEAAVEEVYADAFVTRDGRPVPDLTAANFEVRDEGRLQRVRLVEAGQVPLTAVLVFDTSTSVAGATLGELRAAAEAFVDGLEPADRVRLVTFNHDIVAAPGGALSPSAARDAIAGIEAAGATAFLDALYLGLRTSEPMPGRPVLVAFTDGEDTLSWLGEEAVLRAARESNALVYVVALQDRLPLEAPRIGRGRVSEPAAPPFLEEVAHATGGRLLFSTSAAGLRAAFLEVLNETRTRYLLSFSPDGPSRPGWHELKIRLRGAKGELRARRGYFRRP
jgi:VWFA-related protein